MNANRDGDEDVRCTLCVLLKTNDWINEKNFENMGRADTTDCHRERILTPRLKK